MKHGAKKWLALFLFFVAVSAAHSQFRSYFGYVPERYVILRSQPVYRVYYDEDRYAPTREYYLYDYVNRPNPLTPEPVWRTIFPGIRERIQAERRQFGVSGMSGRELIYWREYR